MRPEEPYDPTSREEKEEKAAMSVPSGTTPFRTDLVEKFCRIAASGDFDRIMLQVRLRRARLTLAKAFGQAPLLL